jgi:hypothetical protein
MLHAGCTIFAFQILFIIKYSRLSLELYPDSNMKQIIRLFTLLLDHTVTQMEPQLHVGTDLI